MQALTPEITVAMPVFNGERYVASAIRSILDQDFTDFELIITDNASSDGTAAICAGFAEKDPRVRYVRNQRNLGAASNYNLGVGLARGRYLKWAAHDDRISPNFLGACRHVLERRPEATLCFGRTLGIDPDDADVPIREQDSMKPIADSDPAVRFYNAIKTAGTCFPIFGLFRVEALRRTTLHRPYYGSDRATLAEIALLGSCLQTEAAVFYNREHPARSINIVDQIERSRWQNEAATRASAMEHVNLLVHLFEIACRHPDIVSPARAGAQLAAVALARKQLARYSLDALRYLSPTAGARIKRLMGSLQMARR
jgi:glycosyltransferase involved in cell wall biosynthesis